MEKYPSFHDIQDVLIVPLGKGEAMEQVIEDEEHDEECCMLCAQPYIQKDRDGEEFEALPKVIAGDNCQHHVCLPCLQTWQKCHPKTKSRRAMGASYGYHLQNTTARSHVCPICHRPATNTQVSSFQRNHDESQNKFRHCFKKNSALGKMWIDDKCVFAFYVLDNSGSMAKNDGKTFQRNSDGTVFKLPYVQRWQEAVSKIQKIATYNIKRGMVAAYFLLNPRNGKSWIEDKDYVVIDNTEKINVLTRELCHPGNITGRTPLAEMTKKFRETLENYVKSDRYDMTPVCFNIITDGQPSDEYAFERELRELIRQYSIFLTINLCTEDESVVRYYNSLDVQLGTEISGLDVIDDFEQEAAEINRKGNRIVAYSMDLHVCRMAGCYSPIADLWDEMLLPPHLVTKLCNEVLGIEHDGEIDIPNWAVQTDEYCALIEEHTRKMPMVYDIWLRRMRPVVDVGLLKKRITRHNSYVHLTPLQKTLPCCYKLEDLCYYLGFESF